MEKKSLSKFIGELQKKLDDFGDAEVYIRHGAHNSPSIEMNYHYDNNNGKEKIIVDNYLIF